MEAQNLAVVSCIPQREHWRNTFLTCNCRRSDPKKRATEITVWIVVWQQGRRSYEIWYHVVICSFEVRDKLWDVPKEPSAFFLTLNSHLHPMILTNSVAKQKHKCLSNVVRSLLFQSCTLSCFWGDVIQTAISLINHLWKF